MLASNITAQYHKARGTCALAAQTASCDGGVMSINVKFGTITALSGGTAVALAMLAMAGSARADELGDLRANQDLLSQRIDQLAQGQSPGSTGPMFSVNQNPAAGAPS